MTEQDVKKMLFSLCTVLLDDARRRAAHIFSETLSHEEQAETASDVAAVLRVTGLIARTRGLLASAVAKECGL